MLTTLLCTHGHFDHVGSAEALRRKYHAVLYCEAADLAGDKMYPLSEADHGYAEGQTVTVDELQFTAWHTPGHTSIFRPGPNSTSASSIRARFFTCKFVSILFLRCHTCCHLFVSFCRDVRSLELFARLLHAVHHFFQSFCCHKRRIIVSCHAENRIVSADAADNFIPVHLIESRCRRHRHSRHGFDDQNILGKINGNIRVF